MKETKADKWRKQREKELAGRNKKTGNANATRDKAEKPTAIKRHVGAIRDSNQKLLKKRLGRGSAGYAYKHKK